jgi:transmembrane sensor
MTDYARRPNDEQIRLDEASAWQLALAADPAREMSDEFVAWHSDPLNQVAFSGVNAAWQAAADFAVEPQLLDMRQAALKRARMASTTRWTSAVLVRRAVAALLVIGVLGVAGTYFYLMSPTVYSTAVGERRTVALADGSRIALDSDTRVEVRFARYARNLTLDRGRARFDVAHDVTRPFSVLAGSETVVAVGTTFDVERINDKVLVTLIHGRILVKGPLNNSSAIAQKRVRPPVSLQAGQELVIANNLAPAIRPANLQIANSWETGRLVFNGDTLADAVARMNRYSDQPIQVDPAIAGIRIVGSFTAGDISTFVSALTSYFPVQANTTADNAILLQPKT